LKVEFFSAARVQNDTSLSVVTKTIGISLINSKFFIFAQENG